MRLAPLLLLGLALAACDRPPLEAIPSAITVVSPDLGELQLDPSITLVLDVDAIGGAESVTVGGRAATQTPEGTWEVDLRLFFGVNALPVDVLAADGASTLDTLTAVHAGLRVTSRTPLLPQPRAAHTTTRVAGGRLLVAGGETSAGGDELSVLRSGVVLRESALVLSVEGEAFGLRHPRSGHTASLLGDGRVLLLGGVSGTPGGGDDAFVAEPEIVDPETGTTEAVPTSGPALRRTGHSTVVLVREGRTYLYVFGGLRPGSAAPFSSGSFAVLELRPDGVLETLSPPDGVGLTDPVEGAAQIVLDPSIDAAASVIVGADRAGTPTVSLFRYLAPSATPYPFEVRETRVDRAEPARTGSAGVRIGTGLGLIAGGQSPGSAPTGTIDLFTLATGFVRVPPEIALGTPRSGHTVTLLPSGRILALGGRDSANRPLDSAEILLY